MEELEIIIQQCAANNRRSQEKLYLLFYPGLFALCKKIFENDHEAIEVLNNGMMKVYKNISSYNAKQGSLFNWAYTIVRNAALDKLKTKRQIFLVELNNNYTNAVDENPLKEIEWKEIYKLLDVLAPATRAVCSLFYLEGFTMKEITEKLGISAGTVKWHLNES